MFEESSTQIRKRNTIAQNNVDQHEALIKSLEKKVADALGAKRAALFTEQSLDEYCHNFLSDQVLDERDKSQVVSRYTERYKSEPKEILVVSELWIWRFGGLSLAQIT